MRILLNSFASVTGTNVDNQIRIDFKNSQMMFDEDILYNIIDETVQFQNERNACTNYLVYGKVESFIDDSLDFDGYCLNESNYNVQLGYISAYEPDASSLVAFTVVSGTTINVASAANMVQSDVILLYNNVNNLYYSQILDISGTTVVLDIDPSVDLTGFSIVPAVSLYKRHFTPLYTSNYIKFYPSSFSTNIFGSAIYQYHTYKNINTSGVTNNLDQPITELVMKYTNTGETITAFLTSSGSTVTDNTIVDYVTYDLNAMVVSPVDTVSHKFTETVDYYYNPYMIIPIRVFSSIVTNVTETTSFDYPDYSILFYSGDIMYKNYLDVGYFEQNTNGIDYPFINNYNYLYNDTKFTIRRVIPLPSSNTITIIDSGTTTYNVITLPTGGARLC